MPDFLGVGIIGFGDGGQSNFKALTRPTITESRSKIIAICDTNTERMVENVPRGHEFELYTDAKKIAQNGDIHLVIVATPDHEHVEVTKLMLEAGKYVFVEKPVATTYNDLDYMAELNRRYPGKILFSEKYSFVGPVQAALQHRKELGEFMTGSTSYTMRKCDRIMGDGKWRTESAYNPVAGGLSHNFMTLLLFIGAPITEVCAIGQVLTYHENLARHGGFDTVRGMLRFANKAIVSFDINLAIQNMTSPYAHRTVTHNLQFRNGSLAYGPTPESDQLIVGEFDGVPHYPRFSAEPAEKDWGLYNLGTLYGSMWDNVLDAVHNCTAPLHTIGHGINVAAACIAAFMSAKELGKWSHVSHSHRTL